MKGTIKKWGNSAAVRIPISVLQAAHIRVDEPVDVREEAGRVIIEPVRKRKYTLEELVAACNPKKRRSREEQEWLDAGREAL